MELLIRISVIILLVPSFSLLYGFELPKNETFSKWTRLLEMKLSDLVTTATQADFAQNVYKSEPAVVLEKVNGEEVLKSVLKKLSRLLLSKKSALKNLASKAEEKFSKFQRTNKSVLNIRDLEFFNMKTLKSNAKMTYDPLFRQEVSFEESGVHIPLEIFDGYPEIVNGLNWSAALDEVFKENQKNDPSLKWQYFGSFFGFMRVYPAFRWPEHPSLPDLFDVRRRFWYTQASVTPKDVIVLIDRSGSVHGPTLDIMKITARALLNSLGENDFVNVAWFNNKVRWIVPCLNSLVQATSQIRRLLSDAVERLTESSLTNYATALDFAFEAFKKFDATKKPWIGSNCQKIILFLSDGGTEWPSDLVTKHCNESRNGRIKIFTFACGPHPIPTVVLKEMACATGGYFSPVTALGSVRIKIQDYIKVLSRSLAYSEDRDMYQWHNFYRDIGGLGLVTTVTLPVFYKNSNNSKSTHLLGVVGIDITVEEMKDLFPKHLLGPFGYPFAINTNGFTIFHPRLHDHIVYIEDPPDVYLSDLEGATKEISEMEKEMIDGLSGSLTNYQSIVPVGLGHAVLVNMSYFYESIEPSTFRFGVAIPPNYTVANIKVPDIYGAVELFSALKKTSIAPWKFCPGITAKDITIEELAAIILSNFTSCDEKLVNHLLWDVGKIYQIQNEWGKNTSPGIWFRFFITSSGLTTVHSSESSEEYDGQTDPLKNNLFKRASRAPGFVVSLVKGRKQTVTVAGKISLGNSFVAAVIGAEIEQEMIQKLFDEVAGSEDGCNSSEFLHCYLLNDGGIITASNVGTSKVGDFIGLHDPELLQFLISKEIFKREFRLNYQSWCSKESQNAQTMSATRTLSVFKLLYEFIISFQWNFLYTAILYVLSSSTTGSPRLTWTFRNMNVCASVECSEVEGCRKYTPKTVFNVSAWKKMENNDQLLDFGNHSCVTRSTWYYHTGVLARSGIVNCEFHTRGFRVSFLPNVTLIFVVSEPPCTGLQDSEILSLDPEEDVEPDHCSRQQHYRLRPGKCYSQIPKQVLSDCGATSSGFSKFSAKPVVDVAFFLLIMKWSGFF